MSLAKNTAYNVLGSVVPILISLVSVPVYLKHAGLERYGILSLCWLLLGYLGLFDFGLGRALSQRIAAMRDEGSHARSAVFWLGLAASFGCSLVAALIALPMFALSLGYMKFSNPEVVAEVHRTIPLLALTLPITMTAGVFSGALMGRERFGVINAFGILSSLLSSTVPLLIVLFVGPQLPLLIGSTLLTGFLSMSILIVACVKAVPLHRPRRAPAGTLRLMLQYGGWVSLTNVTGPILTFVDRFVIGGLISASAVSVYAIPFNLVTRLTLIPDALSRALFPRYAVASRAEAASLCRDSVASISVLVSPAAVIMVALIYPFLRLWVGPAVAGPASQVAFILVPGYWCNCFALIAYNQLHAQGRPDVPAKLHVAEILPFIPLLFVAVKVMGLPGAALVWTLRTSIDAVLMFHFSAAGLAATRDLRFPGLLLAASTIFAWFVPFPTVWSASLFVVLLAGTTLAAYRAAPVAAKQALGGMVARRLGRFGTMKRASD